MPKSIKLALIASVLSFGIILGTTALADETPASPSPTETPVQASLTPEPTDVPASDLGTNDPKILPDSPFYFLKEWGRGIKSLITFSSVKKIELREKIANERILELQKLTDKNPNSAVIQKATEKYRQELDKIQKLSEKIKETTENNPAISKFLEKFAKQQTLHQQILQKLEKQVPAKALEKIKEARQNHIEKFGDVMDKLEANKEKVQEKIDSIKQTIKGNPELQQKLEQVKEKVIEKINLTPAGADCNYYFWIDSQNKNCGYKKFCGAFMYQGLQTFGAKAECLKALTGAVSQ